MKQTGYILALPLSLLHLFSQTGFTGFIDKYPVGLIINIYADGDARAIYASSTFDEPIVVVNGRLHISKLILFEKDQSGKNKATPVFDNFNAAASELKGNWTALNTGKQLKIRLKKMLSIDYGDRIEWKSRDALQPVSLIRQVR